MNWPQEIAGIGITATLIEGESGTGKEIICCFYPQSVSRKRRQMITVNCAAMGNRDLLRIPGCLATSKNAVLPMPMKTGGTVWKTNWKHHFPRRNRGHFSYMQQALLRVLQENR
ncbi:MAG: sigma 54-interacting transcriptional regulator [Bacteroidia bacterium]